MIKAEIDIMDIKKVFENSQQKMTIAVSSQVLKDSNFYIPKDTGMLESSSIIHSNLAQGVIEWKTPYARKLYYNPQYNFKTDVNPNARGRWFEEAKARKINDWLNEAKEQLFK